MNALPNYVYHGTSSRFLPDILKDGIMPRKKTKIKNGWGKFASATDRVYVTTAYAPYFAYNAVKKDAKALVLKINTAKIPTTHLWVADEDVIGRYWKETMGVNFMDEDVVKKAKTKALELAVSGEFTAQSSLAAMGVAAIMDGIPREAIEAYVLMKPVDALLNWDASITPINYKFCGQRYEEQTDNLFANSHNDLVLERKNLIGR